MFHILWLSSSNWYVSGWKHLSEKNWSDWKTLNAQQQKFTVSTTVVSSEQKGEATVPSSSANSDNGKHYLVSINPDFYCNFQIVASDLGINSMKTLIRFAISILPIGGGVIFQRILSCHSLGSSIPLEHPLRLWPSWVSCLQCSILLWPQCTHLLIAIFREITYHVWKPKLSQLLLLNMAMRSL